MNIWLVQHLQVLLRAFSRMLAAPLSSTLNITVIGIALSLPTGVYTLLSNVQRIAGDAVGTPQISVFMAMGSTTDEIARMDTRLRQNAALHSIQFVSRETALQQFQLTAGLTDITAGLKQNPLPHAFILQPKASAPAQLEKLRDELRQLDNVDHVQLDSAWAYKLNALIDFAQLAILLLALLLSLALVAITFNTIRLQILTQQDEIEISSLIGATSSFIRRPFLYFGLLQGLLGGLFAWVIVNVSIYLLNVNLSELAALYASNFLLLSLSHSDSFTLLLFSGYLGWLGAWISVTLHFSQRKAA